MRRPQKPKMSFFSGQSVEQVRFKLEITRYKIQAQVFLFIATRSSIYWKNLDFLCRYYMNALEALNAFDRPGSPQYPYCLR